MSNLKCDHCKKWFLLGDQKASAPNGRTRHTTCELFPLPALANNPVPDEADPDPSPSAHAVVAANGSAPDAATSDAATSDAANPDAANPDAATSDAATSDAALNIIIKWACLVCTFLNDNSNDRCVMCEMALGTPNSFPEVETERWICNVCIYDNNPLASQCALCWFDRDAVPPHWGEIIEPTGDAAGTEVDAQAPNSSIIDSYDFTCVICGDVKSNADGYIVSPDCPSHCNSCFASWIEAQVRSGNAMKLLCPCGQHKLRYVDFQKLGRFLDADVKAIFANSHRQGATKAYEINITCPECHFVNVIYNRQGAYNCLGDGCPLGGNRQVCCNHNIRFSRPLDPTTGRLDLNGTLRCSTCVAEANGDIAVADVLYRIVDALNDRCPSCHGYVGEPEDFNSCMALKCSHCPGAFCGYCYLYGGDWQNTHEHVRYCAKNPRQNYFVESEAVWRVLMERRKLEIVESILAASALQDEDAIRYVRDRARMYIVS